MRKLNKLAAAVAVALSVGVALPSANATIQLKPNARGDTLLFPVFNGYVENYFTVMNNDNNWTQAHIRFRGAAWTGELLDFDVILSPGDVLVFRLADIDGDGYWEVDQSLDVGADGTPATGTFSWSGILQSCSNGSTRMDNCVDENPLLIPEASAAVPQALIEHQRHAGYVEFIGEGVFLINGVPPSHALMTKLAGNAGQFAVEGQREVASPSGAKGTSLWSWVDGQRAVMNSGYHHEQVLSAGIPVRTATDVPNALSGTAFIALPGQGNGLAYNAEAFVDFRTNMNPHRIDNYPLNNAVIIHDENSVGPAGGVAPMGDYVYGFMPENGLENRFDESRISFNNTWGPTLADGDDHALTLLPYDTILGWDAWDQRLNTLGVANDNTNSIAEVEEAIRNYGELFTSFYFDDSARTNSGSSSLHSWYFAHFPTKFYYGEKSNYYGATKLRGATGYIAKAVAYMTSLGKPVSLQVWDTAERNGTGTVGDCPQSPCLPGEVRMAALGEELAFFDIDWIKGFFDNAASFGAGRVVIQQNPRPATIGEHQADGNAPWPMLGYTFESVATGNGVSLGNWRSMHR